MIWYKFRFPKKNKIRDDLITKIKQISKHTHITQILRYYFNNE